MIRPSALALACSLAPHLAEQHPSTSAAADRGHRWHEEFRRALRGDPGEYAPGIVKVVAELRDIFGPTATLILERRVELKDPETGDVITAGTPDAVAVVEGLERRVAFVADLKTGAQLSTLPPWSNLQLHAYGCASALEWGADSYLNIIAWLDEDGADGHVDVGHPVGGDDMWMWLDRVRAAALREPVATTGPHCAECYSRRHCPSWTLPAHEGPSALAPFTAPGGLTLENAPRALEVYLAMRDVLEVTKGTLQAAAREWGGIPSSDGTKVWAPSTRAGRVSVDTEALERDGLLERYQRRGKPFEEFRWRKAR